MKPEVTMEQIVMDGWREILQADKKWWVSDERAYEAIRARLLEHNALKRMLQNPDLQDVLNLREERDTLKQEVERLRTENQALSGTAELMTDEADEQKTCAKKAEAEAERLTDILKKEREAASEKIVDLGFQKIRLMDRAKKAEAEQEALVSSVLEWWKEHEFDTTGNYGEHNVYDSNPDFVTKALAYRAAVQAAAKGEKE